MEHQEVSNPEIPAGIGLGHLEFLRFGEKLDETRRVLNSQNRQSSWQAALRGSSVSRVGSCNPNDPIRMIQFERSNSKRPVPRIDGWCRLGRIVQTTSRSTTPFGASARDHRSFRLVRSML